MHIRLCFFLFALMIPMSIFAQTPAPDSTEALKQQIERMQKRNQDWPQIKRYHDANEKEPPPKASLNARAGRAPVLSLSDG